MEIEIPLFFSLLIILILVLLLCNKTIEKWEIYKQKKYDYIKTGRKPLNYYEQIKYRKPYRYPYKFKKSYPIEHDSYLK